MNAPDYIIALIFHNSSQHLKNYELFIGTRSGTTSSRAIIFNEHGQIQATAQRETHIQTPHSGWVEQDAQEIWSSQIAVVQQALATARILAKDIKAIGLTNQRETTVVWDRHNGKPLAPAIIWQDRRATDWCNLLIQQGQMDQVQRKPDYGLIPILVPGNWSGY